MNECKKLIINCNYQACRYFQQYLQLQASGLEICLDVAAGEKREPINATESCSGDL